MINAILKLIFKLFLPPTIFIFILFISGIVLFFINRKYKDKFIKILSIFLIIISFILYFLSISITKDFLLAPLEKDYKNLINNLKPDDFYDVKYIIVLGSNTKEIKNSYLSSEKGYPDKYLAIRLIEAYKLYNYLNNNISNKNNYNKSNLNNNSKIKIIICGGKVFNNRVESIIGKDFLVYCGINENEILTEEYSKNTYQNLLFAKNKFNLERNRIVIISSSFHMKRVSTIAQYLKLNYLLYPVDFNSNTEKSYTIESFFPNNSNMDLITLSILEYFSIFYHKFFLFKTNKN